MEIAFCLDYIGQSKEKVIRFVIMCSEVDTKSYYENYLNKKYSFNYLKIDITYIFKFIYIYIYIYIYI